MIKRESASRRGDGTEEEDTEEGKRKFARWKEGMVIIRKGEYSVVHL